MGASDENVKVRSMTVPWMALGAGVLLLAPLTARFFRNLWTREPYQFFPLAVAAALLLAVRTWQESDPGPVEVRAWRRWAALVPALVVAVAAAALDSPWTGMVAALLLSGGDSLRCSRLFSCWLRGGGAVRCARWCRDRTMDRTSRSVVPKPNPQTSPLTRVRVPTRVRI